MTAHPLPVPPLPRVPAGSAYADSLADALTTERRLVEELVRVLIRQREAVAGNDLAVVDDSVYAAQRVLLTLQQARRRRHTLMGILTGREDAQLSDIDGALGSAMPDSVREARDDLREAARRLARELDVNRKVLQGAITAGDQLLRALCGVPAEAPAYDRDATTPEPASSGRLFNTQV